MSTFQRENDAAKSLFKRLESAVTPIVSGEYSVQQRERSMAARVSFSQPRLGLGPGSGSGPGAELERFRAECQWGRVLAAVETMRAARIHDDDDYGALLTAEALLEECLLENMDLLRRSVPLVDTEQPRLSKAKGHLNAILSHGHLPPRYLNEALLLMAKVHYVQGRYRDAQGMCARVGLEELTQDDQPTYHLRLLAEAFIIKGLSLDHQTVSTVSRVRLSEREEESLSCFLRACDAALCYLQELDKVVTTPHAKTFRASLASSPVDVDLGYFLQAALQSAYLCLLQRGHLAQGAHQLRRVLRVVESRGSQSFRKCAAMKLAEVLLSSVSEDSYWPPLGPPPPVWLHREGAAASKDAMYPTVKPPQRYGTEGSLCPQDVVEEAVLLLLITESMASGQAVISRLPDQAEARQTSLQDATSVYDLLTICMARRGQYAMLSECLERAMKFSFNEFHLWHQLGLSLMAAGKGVGAVSVFKECARMRPEDPSLPLLAAKICIGQLHWYKEAESLSRSVLSMGEDAGAFLPRAYLALGLSLSLQASEATLKEERNELNRKALQALNKAHSLDAQDAQISMYLALQLALVRQVSAAMEPLQAALSLREDDLHSLHLLTLLLSAQKHHSHALDTLGLALSQHPDNFNLLLTKVKLEEAMFGPAAALQTCEEMLQRWQSCLDLSRSSETDDSSSIQQAERTESSPGVRKTSLHLNLPDFQEASTGSPSLPSVAVSRLEAALSEVSDLSSARRQGPPHLHVDHWSTIWLQAGELFMADGRLKEAQFCVAEASSLSPNSHSVLLQRGRLAELRGQLDDAKGLYDEALAIHPTGERILVHMGRLLVKTGRVHLGEKVLRDAVQIHSTSHEAWSGLGEALQAHGSGQAPDCFLTALELEASCPIRPFSTIPREL
ncbi:LOW QUALITY PROTEIN: tetratricopeptide repeat protein 7A [Cololabis saira]|uniref:LOW QUALITY PROTEIN: tetratricopeptide repeat protein 7A n=1 Tax=Cololabis saira TaxID=129043 RepID=UPI002AD5644C|nr:LOW QUALITY PROTEIN: tetratricopeptide repeat protein 7A [Cololabis saira]